MTHPELITGVQQDAAEAAQAIISMWRKPDDNLCTPVRDMLHCENVVVTHCHHCEHSTNRKEVMHAPILQVALTADNLQDCILATMADQPIDGHKCTQCGEIRYTHHRCQPIIQPDLLIVQLLRFSNKGRKITTSISIPDTITVLDTLYRVNSMVFHQGTLYSGHYTAMVKTNSQWYQCNDTNISRLDASEVFTAANTKVYLIFLSRS